ncbi:MAG: LTA synthase family protein [Oscillospiraceae bacterium]|nr:LTA synthase family protein [Oscillospiraceae bacterium]
MEISMIRFKQTKRLIFGIIVALVVLTLALVNYSSFDFSSLLKFICVYLVMLLTLVTDFNISDRLRSIMSLIFFLIAPVLCFETVRVIVGAGVYQDYIYFDNLIFYAVVQVAVFALTQSVRVSVTAMVGVSYVLHIANQIILEIRGTPLVPTDLYAIQTAMSVTKPDDWHFDSNMLIGTAASVMLIAVAMKCKIKYPKKLARAGAGLASLALTAAGVLFIWGIDYTSFSTSTFDTESTNNVNGIALNFYINCRKMKFDEPEGYSEEALLQYLSQYTDEELEGSLDDLPNIIVIMNESYSDLSYVGKFKTDESYNSYFNSLIEDYPHGKVLVSVLGGGTCNTEFEFLTGLSMMYMPNGSYVYLQHILGDIPSMATYLQEYGYSAIAMHPFYEICWRRNLVYAWMGFDDFVSGEDMTDYQAKYVSVSRWEKGFGDDVEYIRTLISDSYFYQQIIDQYENKTTDRIFIFGVTVQNHSGYEYDGDDFETTVHLTSTDGDYPRTEQYLSLIKASDEALEELITYFENVDEKTIIVFFGDHQPNIETEFLDEISPNRNTTVNGFLTRYETPFVIWANYDIGDDNLGIVSANYLSLLTLEYAGIPLSAEYQLIEDASEIATSMNTWGYFDRYNMWNSREETYDDEVLNMYNFLTYYTLKG